MRTGRRRRGKWPRWELPCVAAVVAAAGLVYGWGLGSGSLHPYYTAAVRSMGTSWHAFLYGGLDPGGSMTIDKLPGALWPQALAVRLWGPRPWAAVLPQVVEGMCTIWLTHRYVRQWAGPVAALTAAVVLTLTPVAIALDRHNIPDTLLTLLLVLSAGAAQRALREDRLRPLLLCGMWVGLAFQAKMLQAWLVLPVFGAVYLYAGPGWWLRRAGRLAATGAVTLAVSCAWLVLVWATPAESRPWLDGTSNNNPFSLVFGYNGLSRFGSGHPTALGAVPGTAASRASGNTGWGMLVNEVVGPQISWFLPLAAMAVVLALVWRRGLGRRDPLRAGFLLWGGWLAVHAVVFSVSNGNHGYYTVVLAPAMAALAGGGLALFWAEHRRGREGARRWALPVALAVTVAWAVRLEWPYHRVFAGWQLTVAVLLGFCGVAGLVSHGPRTPPRQVRWAFAAGVAATLVAPAVWGLSALKPVYSGSSTAPLAGPVGKLYLARAMHRPLRGRFSLESPTSQDRALLGFLTAHRGPGAAYLVAAQSAYTAEPLLRDASQPMLVMGGFTGLTPFPSAARLAREVAAGRVRYALLTTRRPGIPATAWVRRNCAVVPDSDYRVPGSRSDLRLYDCRPTGVLVTKKHPPTQFSRTPTKVRTPSGH